jgi:hypothetical protein
MGHSPEGEPEPNELMSWSQIYVLLDARARDQRTIMLAFFAAVIALLIGGLNASEAGRGGTATFCFCLAFILGLLAFQRGRQVRRTILLSNRVRLKLQNHRDVPPIDADLKVLRIWPKPELPAPEDKA